MLPRWGQKWEAEGLFPGCAAASLRVRARSLEQRLLELELGRAGPGGAGQSRQRPRAELGRGLAADRSSHYTHTKLETTARAWHSDSQTGGQEQNWTWKPSLDLFWTFELQQYLCKKHSQCETVFHSETTEAVSDSNQYRLVESCLSMVTQWRWKHENNRKSWELGGVLSALSMSLTSVGIYEFNAKDLIGHGAFAVVYKGRLKSVSELLFFNALGRPSFIHGKCVKLSQVQTEGGKVPSCLLCRV